MVPRIMLIFKRMVTQPLRVQFMNIISESNKEKIAEVSPQEKRFLIRARPYESTHTKNVLPKGIITFEVPRTHPRQRSFEPQSEPATSPGFTRTIFERVLSCMFIRESFRGPNSGRSSETQSTRPYFSFAPTIRRNSVFPFK